MTPYRETRLSPLPLSTAAQIPAPLWRRLKRLHRRGLNPMAYVGHIFVAVVQGACFAALCGMLGREPTLNESLGCMGITLMHFVFVLCCLDNGRTALRYARAVRAKRQRERPAFVVDGKPWYRPIVGAVGHSPPDPTPALMVSVSTAMREYVNSNADRFR